MTYIRYYVYLYIIILNTTTMKTKSETKTINGFESYYELCFVVFNQAGGILMYYHYEEIAGTSYEQDEDYILCIVEHKYDRKSKVIVKNIQMDEISNYIK